VQIAVSTRFGKSGTRSVLGWADEKPVYGERFMDSIAAKMSSGRARWR
jgi:hypothetical protein